MNRSLKSKFAAPLAAVGAAIALSAAIPAVAQARPYQGSIVEVSYRHGGDYDFRGLQQRINQGVRQGDLTRKEARSLRWQVSELENRADRYSRNGMNRRERSELRDRYRDLSARIYSERHDRQDRRDYRPHRGW